MLRPMSHGAFAAFLSLNSRPSIDSEVAGSLGRSARMDPRDKRPGMTNWWRSYSAAIAWGVAWAPRSKRPGRAPVGSPSR